MNNSEDRFSFNQPQQDKKNCQTGNEIKLNFSINEKIDENELNDIDYMEDVSGI